MASDGPFTEPSSLSLSLSPENERKERATVEKEGLKTRSNRQLLHDEWMGNGRSMDRLGNCVFLPAILLETVYEIVHKMCPPLFGSSISFGIARENCGLIKIESN